VCTRIYLSHTHCDTHTYTPHAQINGGKEVCIDEGCKWLPGKITGGSCVSDGLCDSGLDAEAGVLGSSNQATLLVVAVSIFCFFASLYQFRIAYLELAKKKKHEGEMKALEDEDTEGLNMNTKSTSGNHALNASAISVHSEMVFCNKEKETTEDAEKEEKDEEEKEEEQAEKDSGDAEVGVLAGEGRDYKTGDKKAQAMEQLPAIEGGCKWAKDAGFHAEGLAASKGDCAKIISNLAFDPMIFDVFRDWTQVMSLMFAKLMPQVPCFTSGVGLAFSLFALDMTALFASLNIDGMEELWPMLIFGASGILFVAFQIFWCTQKSNPDAIADGAEVQTYANQSQWSVWLKLKIIGICHFLYLQVCNNVFQEGYDYFYATGLSLSLLISLF